MQMFEFPSAYLYSDCYTMSPLSSYIAMSDNYKWDSFIGGIQPFFKFTPWNVKQL